MTMKILVVDDEALARKKLEGMLRDMLPLKGAEIYCVGTATEAMEAARTMRFHIAFLDIQMPGIDGLQLAEHLQSSLHAPRIVFVTAHDEHAVQAFDLDVADFVTKPVNPLRLDRAVRRALRLAEPETDGAREVVFEHQGQSVRVPIADIWYFRADAKNTSAFTAKGEFMLNIPLAELEETYAADFIRIHRNTLAARGGLHTLMTTLREDQDDKEGWAVMVHNLPEPLPVSRRQLPLVRALLKSKGAA